MPALFESTLVSTAVVPTSVVPGGGPLLATVTVTGLDVALLPAASRATAVSVWVPLVAVVVVHDDRVRRRRVLRAEVGAVQLNCTPTTPTLSVAVAVTVTVPDTVGAAGRRRHRHRRGRRVVRRPSRSPPPRSSCCRPRRARPPSACASPLAIAVVVHDDRVRRRGVLRAEVRAVELELHADDADVVGRRRGHASRCPTPSRPPAGASSTPSAPSCRSRDRDGHAPPTSSRCRPRRARPPSACACRWSRVVVFHDDRVRRRRVLGAEIRRRRA